MNELAAKLKRLEDAHNAVYWNAEQRREAMDAIFAEEPSVSLKEIEAAAAKAAVLATLRQYGSVELSQRQMIQLADWYAAKIQGENPER